MNVHNQLKVLRDLGVTYHNFGTIKLGRKKLHDYYEADSVTIEQEKELINQGVILRGCRKQYAPELKSVLICFSIGA